MNLRLLYSDLASSSVTEEIPFAIGGLGELTQLLLGDNALSGSMPSSLLNLSSLLVVELQDNQLFGPVPELPVSLTFCDVSSNADLCESFGAGNLCTSGLGLPTCVTDCVIMNAWLPAMFNGLGIECCSQTGIACVDDRIIEMYVL